MPDYYSEPFITLAGLTHKSALIAWGAFYFRVKDSGKEFKLVDDDKLKKIEETINEDPDKPRRVVHPPRTDTIGESSKRYGPARVVVSDAATEQVVASVTETEKNHCWVPNLKPDTEYTYEVFVSTDGEEEPWAGGPRRNWELREDGKMGLGPKKKEYTNRFRTFPDPTEKFARPFTFAVIGDFGIGIKKEKDDRRQRQIAEALESAVNNDKLNVRLILTTGDNIYRVGGVLGTGGETGDEDDDWYFTYYQPYRYVINRVPVYPSIGNHDSPETEGKDDREQLFDNFYMRTRLEGEERDGRASIDPGLFYRFRFGSDVEFICIDTSKDKDPADGKKKRLYKADKHKKFVKDVLKKPEADTPTWRIPFCHHPPFCRGPKYGDTDETEDLVELFEDAKVRLVLSGHEHFCQHNRHKGINYFVTGGAGKLRKGDLKGDTKVEEIVSWASEFHFLLITINGRRATVRAVGVLDDSGSLTDLTREKPGGGTDNQPIVIDLP